MDSILDEFYSNMRRLTEENNLSDNVFWIHCRIYIKLDKFKRLSSVLNPLQDNINSSIKRYKQLNEGQKR